MKILRHALARPGVLGTAAAIHLLVVISGAARLTAHAPSALRAIIESYGAYSGAGNSYGFFAPGVAPEWRASLDFYEARERRWITHVRKAPNLELAVLDATINSSFSRKEIREALAASWAAVDLDDVPGAAAVVVRAEAFLLPPLGRYRQGERGAWQTVAAYAFTTDERMALIDAQDARAATQ